MVKAKIKLTGKDAKRLLGAVSPDASGSNYVSPNDLHTPAGVTGQGKRKLTRGSQRVAPSWQEESFKNPRDLHNYPTSDMYRAQRFPEVRLGDAQVAGELNDMKLPVVERVMNPVEAVRRHNNSCRDKSTNLGRGKSGLVVSNEAAAADAAGKW